MIRSGAAVLVFSIGLGLCVLAPVVVAQPADPRLGSWRLVEMTVNANAQPASNSTWIYSQEGSDLRVDVHSVTPTGRTQHWSYRTKRDGVGVRVRGNPAIDRVAVTRRSDRIDEIVYEKAGVATTTGASEISTDGQTMTVTVRASSGGVAVGVYKRFK